MSELLARHRAVIPNWVGIYYDEPIEIVSGQGCRVTDAQGRGYLDFFAGILTNMLGYDVPEVRDAVERQVLLRDHRRRNPGPQKRFEEGCAFLRGEAVAGHDIAGHEPAAGRCAIARRASTTSSNSRRCSRMI